MKKLSEHYRNDDLIAIDPELSRYLDSEYVPTLENLNVENPKILVVFSGGNATGKSALASRIAEALHAVVIENDAIKRAIIRKMPDIDKVNELNPLTWSYSMDLYSRLPKLTTNGLIIRDGVIDWYYDRILPIFEKAGYKIFVVQYDVGKEKSLELIRKRGDTPTATAERLSLLVKDHAIHQERFRSEHTANVVLDESHVFDHDKVIEQLKAFIEAARSGAQSTGV